MKRKLSFAVYFATSVLVATSLLNAQQAAPAAASGMNPTEEQVNDANIQLMRQDMRSQRKKVVAANLPFDGGGSH